MRSGAIRVKTPKTWRLSPRAIRALEQLKEILPGWTETDIVEAAVESLVQTELYALQLQEQRRREEEKGQD